MDIDPDDFLKQEAQRDAAVDQTAFELASEQREVTGRILDALIEASTERINGCDTVESLGKFSVNAAIQDLYRRFLDGEDLIEIPDETPYGVQDALRQAVRATSWYDMLVGDRETKDGNREEILASLADTFEVLELIGEDEQLWLEAMRKVMPKVTILGDEDSSTEGILLRLAGEGMVSKLRDMEFHDKVSHASIALSRAVDEIFPGEHDAKDSLKYSGVFFMMFRDKFLESGVFDPADIVLTVDGIPLETMEKLYRRALELTSESEQ